MAELSPTAIAELRGEALAGQVFWQRRRFA
jgi:hypothetical protein